MSLKIVVSKGQTVSIGNIILKGGGEMGEKEMKFVYLWIVLSGYVDMEEEEEVIHVT